MVHIYACDFITKIARLQFSKAFMSADVGIVFKRPDARDVDARDKQTNPDIHGLAH